jgi:hypothetical protein
MGSTRRCSPARKVMGGACNPTAGRRSRLAGSASHGQRRSKGSLTAGDNSLDGARQGEALHGDSLLWRCSRAPNRGDAWLDRRSPAAVAAQGGAGARRRGRVGGKGSTLPWLCPFIGRGGVRSLAWKPRPAAAATPWRPQPLWPVGLR